MKLKIIFYDQKILWNKSWIFLGSSYSNLKHAENQLKGKRIGIDRVLHESFKEELKNYLEWNENQRIKFEDSTYWWMNDLSGRNNAITKLFLYICQIASLKKILKTTNEDEILLVSDDVFLIEEIRNNFSEYKIKRNNLLTFKIIKNFLFHHFKVVRNLLIVILSFLFNYCCSRITLRKRKYPSGNVYLLHQFIDINSLRSSDSIKSRYFPFLKEYFKKKKLNLYSLPWFEVFWSGKIKNFQKLRKDNYLIVEDWLNIFDYYQSIKNFFKASLCFNIRVKYPNIDIKYLILREKRVYKESIISNLGFWNYMPVLKKWSKNCESLTCIDHYENMIYEHALIAAVKNIKKKTRICGYHHTLFSNEFTAWHSLKSEWESNLKPDCIISLGSISRKMLVSQGIPNERIIDGPALRFRNILSKEKNFVKKNKKNILIPLSQNIDVSIELIDKIKKLAEELKDTEYNFVIKLHPNFETSKILSLLELAKLPKNLVISDENISNLLNNHLIVISMASGVVYDAALNGNVVFSLKSEINLMNNCLDIFRDNFKFLDSHSLKSIKNVLLQFIHNDQELDRYIKEFEKLKLYLVNNINLVNEESLSAFELN